MTRALDMSWPGYAPYAATVRECRRELVRTARSFWLIPEMFPPVTRDDVALLHAFCRRLDDAVDEAPSVDEARAALLRWREELSGRAPARPLIAAFLAGVPRTGLPLECAEALLLGMESDLEPVRIADDDALLRYAYRVSAAVGLMLAPLIGWRGIEAERRVIDLGLGLQVSNILLGVAEDARRGRVYLPATRLARAGLSPEDVLRAPSDRRILPVLEELAALADRYYRSGLEGCALAPLRYRHGILLFARVYGDLGRCAARGEPVPASLAEIPFTIKAQRLAELARTIWHPRTLGLLAPRPHDAALHRAIAGMRGAHA